MQARLLCLEPAKSQQVYKREFSWLSCISFAVSIPGLFASVAITFVYPLEAGGAASAVWCWLISGAGCMCIALSVSELVSAYPTSGGLYFTCKYLAPENWMAECKLLQCEELHERLNSKSMEMRWYKYMRKGYTVR